jgi:hypothetical protein
MSLFRRGEPLHVRLAREGGISLDGETAAPLRPAWDTAGIHGLQRPREWDAVITVEAPEIDAEKAVFVVLKGGDLIVEEGPDNLEKLAAAVESELAPPFRAEAVRREEGLWAVAARSVVVLDLPGVTGDEIELTMHGGERTLVVDGEPSFGTIAQLERPDHVVRARRIDGALWEVTVDKL